MNPLLQAFVDIALLRRDPGALPASPLLLALAAAAYAAASALQSWLLYGADRLLGRTALDLALTMAMFWALLAVARRGHRYLQTATAVLGTGALLSPVIVLLIALKGPATANYVLALLAWVGSIGVIVWYTLIVGRVLQGALDIGFVTGLAIAITFLVASAAVLTQVFPDAT